MLYFFSAPLKRVVGVSGLGVKRWQKKYGFTLALKNL